MARDRFFKSGDFVKYTGDNSIATGPLRNEGIGRIDAFEEFHGVERIDLFLRDRDTNIWCDYGRIRPIETEEKYLLACGYTANMVGERRRYIRGNSIISGGLLLVPQLQLCVMTGFCLADFTGGVAIEKYLHNPTKFDLQLFYQDFPSVNNINDLFDYLKGRNLNLDWEAIANL